MKASSQSDASILALGNLITEIVGTGPTNPYGIRQVLVEQLSTYDDLMSSALANQVSTVTAAKAATQAKLSARRTVERTISQIHAAVLENPAVSNEMLAQIGFPPRRSGSSQPTVPTQLSGLAATPQADGTVKLIWDRSGNSKGAMFVVEASADGVNWTMVKSTTRVSYLAEGFAPGVTAYFRVTATTSTAASLPSQTVGVYLPSAPARPALKIAA